LLSFSFFLYRKLISSFIRIIYIFFEGNIRGGGRVCDFYVSIFENHFLIKALSIKIDVGTTLHNLGS
jgi:hypothetical protein